MLDVGLLHLLNGVSRTWAGLNAFAVQSVILELSG